MAAHLVKGRNLTAWQTIQDDLQQMGAKVKDQPVVKDRNWITSRKPEDLDQFSSAIVDELEHGDAGVRDTARARSRALTFEGALLRALRLKGSLFHVEQG